MDVKQRPVATCTYRTPVRPAMLVHVRLVQDDLAPAREEARMAVICVCRRREFGRERPLHPAVAFN